MSRAPVDLRVGGQTYRVVASAGEDELRRLAQQVDARLKEITGPGRAVAPQSLVLVAMALAHDLEEERARRRAAEDRAREMLRTVLRRIDDVLGELPAPEPPGADAAADH